MLTLGLGARSGAQAPVSPQQLAELRASRAAAQTAADPRALPIFRVLPARISAAHTRSLPCAARSDTGALPRAARAQPPAADLRDTVDLYASTQLVGDYLWFYSSGGSETVYWALDDGKMGAAGALVGGGRVTEYQFIFGLHADSPGDTLRPYVIVSFYNAPPDPVAAAANPVVEPPDPVSSVGWLFDPITLPDAGFYALYADPIDLAALGLAFPLDDTFYVEILPLEWSSYPGGSPILDPDVFAIFTGPGDVVYGQNQDHMWSDLWVRYAGGAFHTGDGDWLYDHPAEMDVGGYAPYLNQSGALLRGLPCDGANQLALRIHEPADICVQPGQPVTVTLSQSCLPGLVNGYQAFLEFDAAALTFVSGTYLAPGMYGLAILDPIVATGGLIDLAAGVDPATQPPTSTSSDLVELQFVAGANEGLTRVRFRAHEPPTRFSDPLGEPVAAVMFDTPDICVDGTPPVLEAPATVSYQCPGQVPPAATDYASFVAQGGIAVDDGCYGPIPPTVELVSNTNNGGAGCPASPLVITRVYRAADCAGNATEKTHEITVIDDTPPVVTDCPADAGVVPIAGQCEALVSWAAPAVTDNCDSSPLTEYLIDLDGDGDVDNTTAATSFTFPAGAHRVTVRATDDCGNVNASCGFDVAVADYNELVVDVQLGWVFTGQRCITLELWTSPTLPPEVVKQVLTFDAGLAAAKLVPVPCGVYTCITARDTLHTLRRTDADDFGVSPIVGTQYRAYFTDRTPAGGDDDRLVGGNLNDDSWIDVLDFGIYTWQWAAHYDSDGDAIPDANTTCSTPYPHAEINGSGVHATTVWTDDFGFIQINFLKSHDPNCFAVPGPLAGGGEGPGPVTAVAVAELEGAGLGALAAGDLNADGWLDVADIAAFMQGARPGTPPAAAPPPGRLPAARGR